MSNEKQFMKEAVMAAQHSVHAKDGGPFGSVIVKDGRIIGKSGNKVFLTNDPTAHAEIMAIREASSFLQNPELKGCEIYSLGEPCPMCLAAIYWSGIEKIFYANTQEEAAEIGFDDSEIYHELSLKKEERKLPMQHLPDDAAAQLFKEWDEETDTAGLPQT